MGLTNTQFKLTAREMYAFKICSFSTLLNFISKYLLTGIFVCLSAPIFSGLILPLHANLKIILIFCCLEC